MPKVKISEYSATANSNTDVASINIDEGCAPSGINNAIRAIMGHLKDFQQGTNGDPFNGPVNGTVGATTANTGAFTTLSASSTVTLSGGTANGVPYLNGSKVLTTGSALTFDGSALTVSASVAGASLTSSGAYSYLAFSNSGGATKAGLILTNSSGILQSRAETLAWTNYDASSEYMRIASATGGVGAVGIGYSTLTSVGNNGLAVLGNVGIGTSSPGYKLDVLGNVNRFAGSNVDGIFLSSVAATDTSYYGANYYNNNGTEGVNASGRASWRIATLTAGSPTFSIGYRAASAGAGTFTTPLTIDSSGNLLVGITSTTPSNALGFVVNNSNAGISYTQIQHASGTSSGASYEVFYYNASPIGSITQNGTTGVLYNLTSDYRLKNHQQALTGAKDFIMALKPKKWQWWDGSGEGVGFVAHEFMEVAKHSGNGEKDAVDADGKPVYQSIQPSSSEVMANLVAFVQELKAEFDAYKASHP